MITSLILLSSSFYCPSNYSYDSINRVCANENSVLGPFSDEMVKNCEKAGGGNACKGNKWYKPFALALKGTGVCPTGTILNNELGYCLDSKGVYGPFLQKEVDKCYKVSTKELCESLRWSADTAQIVGLKNPTPKNEVKLYTKYYFQLNNRYEPYATCGVSSAAMLLSAHGINVTPDQLYIRFGKRKGQSPGGLASIYKAYGLYATSTYTATRMDIKRHLDSGRPVVVHGWMTGPGHIVTFIGYNEKGWIVNDPRGVWKGCYKCGFKANLSGKGVVYSYKSLYGSVMGYDKQIWISTASKTKFL